MVEPRAVARGAHGPADDDIRDRSGPWNATDRRLQPGRYSLGHTGNMR